MSSASLMMLAGVALAAAAERPSEIVYLPGLKTTDSYSLPRPSDYVSTQELPESFSWGNVDGVNYLTKNLNQHLPQYCGSCWAHGALSSLADRIKIARGAKGIDINLSVQFILNCGSRVAGSCHGGSHIGTYAFVKETGFVPYDTCLQYEACSAESTEGTCGDGDYSCSAMNTCRTCNTFSSNGGFCSEIDVFPNATIAEYGVVKGEVDIMKEVYTRGPVAAEVNANPLVDYEGGIFDDPTALRVSDHIVAIVGWGVEDGVPYWIVRNSWGEYWGELGFFRIKRGENQLAIESACAWATPGTWTEHNYPCYEDGGNCASHGIYEDPAKARGVAKDEAVSAL